MNKKKFLYGLSSVLGMAYIGFCAAVYWFPRYFFYNPNATTAAMPTIETDGFSGEKIEYKAADGTKLYGALVKPQAGKKLIVFYHGNSYNIAKFYYKLKPLVDKGYGVFIGEYRGFGGVKGKITQAGLELDALAAIDKLHDLGYKNQQIVLYGMSLGSYTSSYTATHAQGGDFAGLILEVPFDSLLNVVKQRIWPLFPFKLIIKDKYDNIANIKDLTIPKLIMAGTKDKTVPPQRAESLFEVVPEPKKFITYEGADHSELFDYENYRDILKWLAKLK